ncbi:MAG TPA: GTPase HflX [Methylococcales bacterium]|nr:GTPase HflX [Methylococcaceae bacterium]HIN69055.1 GTPase HflX [Methylococcales bacterium]
MFDRPKNGKQAVLVHMALFRESNDLNELQELVLSAGAQPLAVLTGRRNRPEPKYFIGTGKLEELKHVIQQHNADVVIFNHTLSPRQERNLEEALETRVVDRQGLILDIFAQRAKTHEGKLQVELAQLQHSSTRLIRSWTHLERQRGGVGLRGGPGETQLEADRRLIRVRIRQIRGRLEKIIKQRQQGRIKRKRAEIPSVSLVGYTNAGKSTLFNALVGSDVYAANQLFATLDPTLRRCCLPNDSELILADTVGFIRQLPHELVAAFRSTLQEASEADLLLHIVDCNAENRDETINEVNQVLQQIGAGKIRQLQVFNKIDLADGLAPRIDYDADGVPFRVWVSAKEQLGFDLLLKVLEGIYASSRIRKECYLSPLQGGVRASLYRHSQIISDEILDNGGWRLTIEIEKKHLGLLKDINKKEIA